MNKNLKIGGAVLVVCLLAGLLMRHPTSIDYTGQATEYSPVDADTAIPHEVVIQGTYYASLLGRDRFRGTFSISGLEGISDDGVQVDFDFNPKYRYAPLFLDAAGQPSTTHTQIAQLLFDKNFSRVAVQLREKDENGVIHAASSDASSHFLVLDAPDRETALSQYNAMLQEKVLR